MTTHLTPGARVVCPGGIQGTVERISTKLRAAVLVKRDDGTSKSYAPGELTRVERERGQVLP